MAEFQRVGFIGLGVMGEPICRNLAVKCGLPVAGCDTDPAPLQRLAQHGVTASTIPQVMQQSDVVFLSLPSGEVVAQLSRATDGLLANARAGQLIVDLSTSPVDVTRELAREFAAVGATFIDAPVARTRAAAEAGTLSVMIGGDKQTFDTVKPLVSTFANEITYCGPIGSGQVVKILNNMVLFETVVALSEARAIARRSGVDPQVLLETFTRGSADSFALRNHGLKAILPGDFPEKAFPVDYARKDLRYALALAEQTGVQALGARNVDVWFDAALVQGQGNRYFPVISRVIDAE
ncbi:NAD(P)-dependent oxidoreductase [Achromobacter denitrificans]|uniref:NAD(P)-dependent oxidoreductase n=1 Tax=Achromobacter denitrificans TaxID=32002 RepID=UPI0023E7EB39|nr:NAD(P)-dependent oxidoreductase [Achromobacter denitrificans]MDF3850861.1 NAD(P)-dependent oxidoreductase [Achromobacter denitrificans]MDF3943772.1 NAD(P)-dependent oxidoreductase [Achromobacter denitrificans]